MRGDGSRAPCSGASAPTRACRPSANRSLAVEEFANLRVQTALGDPLVEESSCLRVRIEAARAIGEPCPVDEQAVQPSEPGVPIPADVGLTNLGDLAGDRCLAPVSELIDHDSPNLR